MKKMYYAILFFLFLLYPSKSQAVIPPDFIFNIGAQVFQFFSAILIFFSALFGLCYEFLRAKIGLLKHRRALIVFIILGILVIALGASYYFARLRQQVEYQQWLAESKAFAEIENIPEEKIPAAVTSTPPVATLIPSVDLNFFKKNKTMELSITNENFKNILAGDRNNFMILDARENIEFENGHFPGATHIRFADIKASEWKNLPTDKVIYIFCWSGIRGKEVAEFLRTKNIVGVFLETGANGWYDFGGTWEGNIKFAQKYTDLKFQKVFTTEETKKYVQAGVILVDSREPEKFKKSHIKGSISIPILHTPTSQLEQTFAQVPAGSRVITICDEYVNCFDAKITGVELEKRGSTFVGRYNKPWEYEN